METEEFAILVQASARITVVEVVLAFATANPPASVSTGFQGLATSWKLSRGRNLISAAIL